MKKFSKFFALSLFLLIGSEWAEAQSQTQPRSSGSSKPPVRRMARPVKKQMHRQEVRSAPTWNIRTEPIQMFFGYYNVSLDYALTPHWVIGGEAGVYSFSSGDLTISGTSFSVAGKYYFSPFGVDGFYAGGNVGVLSLSAQNKNSASASASGMAPSITGGYHWFWNRFNMNLGGSLATVTDLEIKDSTGKKQNYTSSSIGLNFGVGYTF